MIKRLSFFVERVYKNVGFLKGLSSNCRQTLKEIVVKPTVLSQNANMMYTNWLNYYVYQVTPYEL